MTPRLARFHPGSGVVNGDSAQSSQVAIKFPLSSSSASDHSTSGESLPLPFPLRTSHFQTPSFSFSSLFHSHSHSSTSTLVHPPRLEKITTLNRPPPPIRRNEEKRSYKVRSPSLEPTKSDRIGTIKRTALGLARKVSLSVSNREVGTKRKNGTLSPSDSNRNQLQTNRRGMGSMRKIGEREFPNVGALREARREKLKQGEEEGTGKLMAGKKGRRSSNGLGREPRTPAKVQSAVSPYQGSRRRTSPALPTPKTPRGAVLERKVKLKPRTSFPRSPPTMTRASSATTKQGMMNRPRAVPRRQKRKSSIARFDEAEEEEEEDAGKEWLDEAQTFDHFVHPLRPTSRLSITPILRHLPFLRSYTPVQPPPLKLSPTSSTSSSRSNTTLSPNRSHPKDDPSDESFHCRGEDTPTSTREPPLPRTLDTPTREGSPWSEIHFGRSEWRDRSVGETSSDSPESSVSRRSRRNPKWRVHGNDQSPSSIASPPQGDLTRFLEDLLIEERTRPAELLEEEVLDDVFADAPEANENDATSQEEKESGEYEYEISVVRTESLTRSFKLGQPRGGSTRIIEYRSPLASPTSLHFHEGSRTDFLTMSTNAQAEGGELVEPIKVVSASRETFIRGPLVRKGSLSSLGLLLPIPTSTDPIEEPEDKREESILATLQDQARHRNPRPLPTRPTLSPSRSTSFLRSKTFTATSFESRQTPRSATPLPFLNTFGTPSSSFSFEKEKFVTAPSTPYESIPLPVPSTSTSSILSTRSKSREEEEREEREEAQPRTPISPLFNQDQDASFKMMRRRRQEVIERIRSESKKRKRRETIMFSSTTTLTRGIEFHHDHFFDESNGVGRQGRDGEEEEGEKEGYSA